MKTFAEICENWNKIINSIDTIPKSDKLKLWTNVRRLRYCVVGEAWGYSEYYAVDDVFPIVKPVKFCATCREFSSRFSYVLSPAFYLRDIMEAARAMISEELLGLMKKRGIKIEEEDFGSYSQGATDEVIKDFVEHWNNYHL